MITERAAELEGVLARTLELEASPPRPAALLLVANGIASLVAPALGGLGALAPQVPIVAASAELPAFVDRNTLALGLFAAAGEHETLELLRAARDTGATVLALRAAGARRGRADEWDLPALELAPDSSGELSLGALLTAVLVLVERAGVGAPCAAAIASATAQLERRAAELAGAETLAASLARGIGRSVPLVTGVEGIGASAARWWKAEVNLRLKSPAFSSSEPEASYLEVAGFGLNGDLTRQILTLVRLRHDFEPTGVRARSDVALELVRETLADVLEVHAEGAGELAQFLDLLLIGEQVCCLRAKSEGLDPGPVPVLADIERGLAERA